MAYTYTNYRIRTEAQAYLVLLLIHIHNLYYVMADYHYYKGTYYFKDYDNIWSNTQPFIVVEWK